MHYSDVASAQHQLCSHFSSG